MTKELKRWIPVCFPMGPFAGSVNIALKGSSVLLAEEAKELIDMSEEQMNNGGLHTNMLDNPGSTSSEGTSTLPEGRGLCPDVHTSED